MNMRTVGADAAIRRSRIGEYMELTKPRVTSLVLITTLVGFYMGASGSIANILLFHAVVGVALVAGGASALNQYQERHQDAQMHRTRDRPLPEGRISETDALVFSWVISVAGISYLAVFTNFTTGVLAACTLLFYVFLYTPLKSRTALATLIGAIPGAAPPILGWTAAGGSVDSMAGALFAIVFLWQLPHFLAIAWLYDEDYMRGGFRYLTIRNAGEGNAARQIILYCCALIPISLLPTSLGLTGTVYMFGALVAGLVYLGYGLAVAFFRSPKAARRLLKASILYLPAVFFLMVIDKAL
jgi:protoheme IX farnesyltransferase